MASVRCLLLASGLVTATFMPAPSLAAGMNMAWTDCAALGGTPNLAFACDTNAGSHALVGTFVLPSAVDSVMGCEIVIDLVSQQATLPAWWELFFTGACRQPSLTIAAYDGDGATCADWARLRASMNIADYLVSPVMTPAPNIARIKCVNAVQQVDAQSLVGDREYGGFQLEIDHQKTVGSPSCADCGNPVCLVFNSLKVVTAGNRNDVFLASGTTAASNIATWQGPGGNCQAVPVRRETWGRVKALYR